MLEVLKEIRRQIGKAYDQVSRDCYAVTGESYDRYFEGKKVGLDQAWQIVDEVINKLEGIEQNDR